MEEITKEFGKKFRLSTRQLEIGELLSTTTMKASEIAVLLKLGQSTVAFHRTMLYAKLGVTSRLELVNIWHTKINELKDKGKQ